MEIKFKNEREREGGVEREIDLLTLMIQAELFPLQNVCVEF